ncbi:hypothetical protein FB446DRAFT_742283 [Lentinula raphanica]|nr:hypothetical protein FB446DRAFT_742283 [Lentinula raphanica]
MHDGSSVGFGIQVLDDPSRSQTSPPSPLSMRLFTNIITSVVVLAVGFCMAYETVVHCTDDTQDATTPSIPHDVDLTLRAAAPSTTPTGATKSGQGSAQGQATSSQTSSKPSKAAKKLGNGVIAAIVIGILALFGFLAILLLLLRKRTPESSSDHGRGNSKANDTLAPSPFIAENGNADTMVNGMGSARLVGSSVPNTMPTPVIDTRTTPMTASEISSSNVTKSDQLFVLSPGGLHSMNRPSAGSSGSSGSATDPPPTYNESVDGTNHI